MVSELRLAKGIMKISTTLKKFLKKCMKVASHLKKGIKEVWDLIFSSKKEVTETSTKDERLFLTLIGTFQDENIWAINSGASRHMTFKPLSSLPLLQHLNLWESSNHNLKTEHKAHVNVAQSACKLQA